ncbi:hypothetical protein [Pontibacillus litoralis]|uniref:Uncharacterized protein n=1 Tax=Pontibacillus litoralis JSM 072002 TaxID=1385512 RepID=A0A0A5HUU8_9BACI|nr:hypothetical protein [Pontibacillus litoralis]KGX87407.1 hypothetical protein N784_15865 [Pontibacillus litoralis JSM 072002]
MKKVCSFLFVLILFVIFTTPTLSAASEKQQEYEINSIGELEDFIKNDRFFNDDL